MIPELDDYDWAEVFGEGCGGNCTTIAPLVQPPGADVSNASFGREDVDFIIQKVDGENDGDSWVCYGLLKDGRYFAARGSCDYTGWDCRASNSGDVAATEEHIIRFGLGADERSRFGLTR